MQDQNNKKDIFSGEAFEYIRQESINNKELWNGNGGMIDNFNDHYLQNSRIGVEFMINFLNEIKPKNILETGTNYGSFSYLCYETLDDFNLQTCDVMAESKRVIDFLNNHYGKNNVTFYNQTSWEFLLDRNKNNEQFDLAWVDSAHNYDYLLGELNHCASMDIPNIVVDDFAWIREVQLGVFEFLRLNEKYTFHSYSNNDFPIGSIVTLKHRVNGF
jgi:hypothetical protein